MAAPACALPEVSPNLPRLTLEVLNSGFYGTNLNMIKKGNPKEHIWGPALWFIIRHPVRGIVLFDTGYAYRYYDAVRRFPYSLLKVILPVKVTPDEDAVLQLERMGISPDDVSIVLSHLHIDHAGGIHDFPNAPIYLSKEEWDIAQQSSLKLLTQCYLKELFCNIDPCNVHIVDFSKGKPYGPFPESFDLFGDGSLILVPLFGHAVGQMGMVVNCSPDERYLLAADSVYCRGNYEELAYGSPLSNIAHTDVKRYHEQYKLLHDLAKANPELSIIPSHDPGIYKELFGDAPKR